MNDLRCAFPSDLSFEANQVPLNALKFDHQRCLNAPGLSLLKRDVAHDRARDTKPSRDAAVNAAVKPNPLNPDLRRVKLLAHAVALTDTTGITDWTSLSQEKKSRQVPRRPMGPFSKELGRFRAGVLKMTQKQLADELGVSQVAVARWEQGRRKPEAKIYLDLARLAGANDEYRSYFWSITGFTQSDFDAATNALKRLPPGTILSIHGDLPRPDTLAQIPIIADASKLGEDDPALTLESVIGLPMEWCAHPEKTICIRAEDESMSPLLEKDYIAVVDTAETDRALLYENMVVVRSPSASVLIRWLRKVGAVDMLIAQHTSPRFQPAVIDEGWAIIGRVTRMIGEPPSPKGKRQ